MNEIDNLNTMSAEDKRFYAAKKIITLFASMGFTYYDAKGVLKTVEDQFWGQTVQPMHDSE